VLLPYTNLSLSSFELLYEDTAVDFLGNAKSYMLLLTTAALAARFNLRYGWDFGGILVPALLGLLWFTPTELAITLAEALLLWVTTLAALRWTPLGRLNLEGPRKVALVFTLSVALKWLLSLGVGDRLVGLPPRDLFGFGYLLSSCWRCGCCTQEVGAQGAAADADDGAARVGAGQRARASGSVVAPVTGGGADGAGGGESAAAADAARGDGAGAGAGRAGAARRCRRAVPVPVREAPAAEGAALLAGVLDARAVVVAGRDGGDEAFAAALARLSPGTYVELRAAEDVPRDRPAVHVEATLPAELDVRGLGAARLEWAAPPTVSGAPWGSAARVVLRVHPGDLRAALSLGAPKIQRVAALLPWLAERERGPAIRPLVASAPPSTAELVFLERRVARPLIGLERAANPGEDLAVATRMAGLVDHAVWDIGSCGASSCVAMAEANRTLGVGWATLVTRGRGAGVIEAPHPREEPGTARLAAELWTAGDGRVLIVGGGGGAYAPLQAIHQAALVGGGPVVQVRGLGREEDAVVIGLGQPALDPRPLPAAIGALLAPGGPLAWVERWKLADGSAELGPLSGAGNAQIEFAVELAGSAAAVLWFPPRLRAAYAPHDPCPALVRVAALGVGAGCGLRDEAAALIGEDGEERTMAEFLSALERVEQFAEQGDLHLLRAVIAEGWRLDAGIGQTGRGFVALRGGGRRALVWLGPANPGRLTVAAVRSGLWVRGRSVVIGPR
jgi:hypothetical protein